MIRSYRDSNVPGLEFGGFSQKNFSGAIRIHGGEIAKGLKA